MSSKLVDEVVDVGDAKLETLSLSDDFDELTTLGRGVEDVTWNLLPMVEDALREGTAGGGCSEGLSETERLSDGEVGLDNEEGSTGNGLFTDNDTSSLGKSLIDTTHSIIR